MDGMTRLGVVFLPDWPPERLLPVARVADEAGLEELWLWEDCFKESGVASAAAALAATRRLRIGIGLLPVPLRNVALTAMEVATLHRLFDGRIVPAVGHGVQEWMAQVGARVSSPLTLLREYTVALRALLAGQQVTTAGRYVRLDAVALDWPPSPAPAILAGATGPRTLQLSGEVADGTVLTAGTTPARVRAARGPIDAGRAAAGRTDAHTVVAYLHAATGPGAADRIATEYRRWGYDTRQDGRQEISVAGDAAAIADAVHRFASAGADTVVLQPTADEPDPEAFVRTIATQVRPLVT